MTRLQKILDQLNEQEFVKALQEKGDVFLVGGIVRDSFLDRDSKDIDLIVTGIPEAKLEGILKPFGRVDKVGQSFGVIKFVPDSMELDEPIDIALPRVESKKILGYLAKKGHSTIYIKYGGIKSGLQP